MNSTIAKLADEFEKMEKTIASQKKMIETLMPTGYVDTDTVKLHLNSVYGVMFGGRPSPKRYKLEDCSWDASYLRAKLNGNFFEKQLPADLKAVIKPVVKITAKSGKNEMLVPSVDKLFVLSEQEVFGRKIYSCGGEGKWYEWYKRENTPYGKCKQNGERDWRWERSPYSGTTTDFCCVNDNGSASYGTASYSLGVSFGFCI